MLTSRLEWTRLNGFAITEHRMFLYGTRVNEDLNHRYYSVQWA